MTLASSSGYLARLFKLLTAHFSLEELRTLCFDLNADYDTLRGDEKATKALELISLMLREHRLDELVSTLRKERPDADWPAEAEQPSPDELLAWATPGTLNAADYLVALRDYCANLPYLTLHDIRPPKTLDEVYVPLKARPQPRKDDKEPDSQSLQDFGSLQPLSISDVMRQHDPPHVLILGEPGAGKSTLLRQLAEHAWDAPDKIGLDKPHLPILVPLRRLAIAEGALEERLNRALTAELTLTQALPQGVFTNWPKQTGASWLILLDALDEVPAEQRAQLMQWLKGLLGRIGQNRVILTSRPSGYAQGELDDKLFGHYDLLSFTLEQTGEFAAKWFGDKANDFLKELERICAGDLRGTPLLLTIAAKVYLERGTLPERRSGLYGQFVDIWLTEAEQRGVKAELGERVCKVAKLALAKLALAMTEQPSQVSQATLSQVAAAYLREALHRSEDEAEADGLRFVQVMARRSGVLTRRSNAYDFIHPTFREYLAAFTVVRESGQDMEQVWQRAVSRWADENWREVALFALGILSDKGRDVASFIKRIWQSGAPRRILVDKSGRLHFAGTTLVEQVNVDVSLSNDIIDDLLAEAKMTWWSDTFPTLLGELRGYQRAGEGLLVLARDAQVETGGRTRAVKALGRLGWADDLAALACDVQVNGVVREVAAKALGELGRTDEASSILLALARDVQIKARVRGQAVVALIGLRRIDNLLALARDGQMDELIRVQAAEALGNLERAEESTQAWLALVHDEQVEAWVRVRAAEALGRLGDARVLPDLERIAGEDKSKWVCRAARRAIKWIRRRMQS